MCLHEVALDALEAAVLVRRPGTTRVELANRIALEHGLVRDGVAIDVVVEAAKAYDEHWPGCRRFGIDPPARGFQHDRRQWFLRARAMPDDLELITCRREVLGEGELLAGLQRRYRLTDRQADVLRHLLRGSTTRGTAEALHLSEVTVRHHRRAALEALGVPNAPAAVLLAEAVRKGSG